MRYDGIIVHYAELATKGRNRGTLVRELCDNLRRALAGEAVAAIERQLGRIWIVPEANGELGESALAKCSRVVGVANCALALCCPLELEAMKETALALVRDRTYASFRVRAHRSFKEMPFASLEVDHEVGGYLFDHKPARVQMRGAELEIVIEMLPQGAFIYCDRRRGPGGLPSGMSGTVACMLSGGIDSPVAAYRMLRRGCRALYIHFHSQPFLGKASEEKVIELVRHLTIHQARSTLFLVPLGELQREVVTSTPMKLRVILYRRFMMRLASRIGLEAGAKAIVTGEALGQVASQTLTNLTVINDAASLPVLRPLISFDKQEIIDQAQLLGCFEISIQPDQDCCQLFVPSHPETHAKLEEVVAAEAALDIEALCADTLRRTSVVAFDAQGKIVSRLELHEAEEQRRTFAKRHGGKAHVQSE